MRTDRFYEFPQSRRRYGLAQNLLAGISLVRENLRGSPARLRPDNDSHCWSGMYVSLMKRSGRDPISVASDVIVRTCDPSGNLATEWRKNIEAALMCYLDEALLDTWPVLLTDFQQNVRESAQDYETCQVPRVVMHQLPGRNRSCSDWRPDVEPHCAYRGKGHFDVREPKRVPDAIYGLRLGVDLVYQRTRPYFDARAWRGLLEQARKFGRQPCEHCATVLTSSTNHNLRDDHRGSVSEQSSPTALPEDGKSDWIPDALGYADLLLMDAAATARARTTRPCGVPLHVPLAERWDTVWRLDPVWRAELNRAVQDSITPTERSLATTVYGNKDLTTPYGLEYNRMLVDMRVLAAEGQVEFVAVADIHRFSRSVTMRQLEGLSCLSPESLNLFSAIAVAHGTPLVHGVRACSRIANLLLQPIDEGIGVPFQRWADGYYLYADSHESAALELARLSLRLAELGFRLNEQKTRIERVSSFLRAYGSDASLASGPLLARLQRAMRVHDSRTLRFVLPRLHTEAPRLTAGTIRLLAKTHPRLLPRLAEYLDSTIDHPESRRAVRDLIRDCDSWSLSRLLPVLARNPSAARSVRSELAGLADVAPAPIAHLALRCQQLAGLRPRLDDLPDREYSAFLSDPNGSRVRPSVATTL